MVDLGLFIPLERMVYKRCLRLPVVSWWLVVAVALAMHLDNFEIIGIEILVGYGLTETSPSRMSGVPGITYEAHLGSRFQVQKFALLIPKLVSPYPLDSAVSSRGPQIMQGYYQNPEMTAKAIDSEGWFNTGDLGCDA